MKADYRALENMGNLLATLFGAHAPIDCEIEEETMDLRVCDGKLQRRFDVVTQRVHYGWEWPETISVKHEWRDVPIVGSAPLDRKKERD